MKLSFRTLAGSICLSIVLGLVVGCNSPASEGESNNNTSSNTGNQNTSSDPNAIKIGLVASMTGDLKPWGVDSEAGARLAIDEINKAGGINGKKVELIVEDSGSSPEQGKTAAERLINKGCVSIVGEVASGITAQIASAAESTKTPVVSVGATKTNLPGIGEWVFRVCYTDDLQGPVMANFAYKDQGLRNVAIMTDVKQPYSVYLSETFKKTFIKLGGKIVDEQKYESGTTQFSSQLTNIKAKNPDGLFLSGYFNEVGPMVRQAAEQGIRAVYMGGDGWDSSEIRTSGGEAIIGGYFCNHYNNNEDRKEVQEFLTAWKAAYGGKLPGTTMGALGYDAVKLVGDALKRAADPTKREDVVKAINETENFPGVTGTITLKGKKGNPDKRALVVSIGKDDFLFEKAYEASDVEK